MDELQPWGGFDELFPLPRFFARGFWQPSVDLAESAGEFIVWANLPGMKPKDIELTVDENSLTLQGEIQEEKTAEGERFYRRERRRGSFVRRIPLQAPVRAEAVKATFNDGVLEVRLPKVEPAIPRGRRIEIQ